MRGVGGGASSPAAPPAFLECVDCCRWLCVGCRKPEPIGRCVVCPGLRSLCGGHTGTLLRAPRTAQSQERVAELISEADMMTRELRRGRLLQSGRFAPETEQIGRGARVAAAVSTARRGDSASAAAAADDDDDDESSSYTTESAPTVHSVDSSIDNDVQ